MHKNNFYISFGIWITIIPFFGIPGNWRNALIILSGLFLILVSVGPVILKKLQTKQKSKKKPVRMTDTIQSGGQNKVGPSDTPLQNDGLRFSVLEDSPIEPKTEE